MYTYKYDWICSNSFVCLRYVRVHIYIYSCTCIYVCMNIYVYTRPVYIHTCMRAYTNFQVLEYPYPTDPINDLCSLPGTRLQKIILLIVDWKHTKSCMEDQMLQDLILRTRLCTTGFITHPGWLIHFHPTKMVAWKCFAPVRYQLPKSRWVGMGFKIFLHHG